MATRVQQPTRSQAAAWEIGAFLRHFDYLLLLATGGLVAYGLWVLESVTRNDIAGDPDYYVFRKVIYVVVGAILLARAVRQFHTYPATSPLCTDAIAASRKVLASLDTRERLSLRITPREVVRILVPRPASTSGTSCLPK